MVHREAPDEPVAKAQALTALLRWAAGQGVKIVSADLTVPSAPSAKLAAGGTVMPSP